MNTTFYGVLGVGPDAGDDAIRAAYRERVKDHHPDVSAAPDATERFKRITSAKEVLLDPKERGRYDRLGHASYVDAHGDTSLWAIDEEPAETASAAPAESAATETKPAAESRSATEHSRTTTGSGSDTDGESASSTDPSRESQTRTRSRASARSRTATSGSRAAASGKSDRSTASTDSGSGAKSSAGATRSESAATGRTTEAAAAPSESTAKGSKAGGTTTKSSSTNSTEADAAPGDGPRSSARRNRTRSAGAAANDRAGRSATTATTGSYARSSFWDATDADVSDVRHSDPISDRAIDVVRTLGAWVLVHLLFLALAVGTGWYVYAVVLPPAARSLPLLFVLVGEVGLAVVLSSLHILSRVYR